MSTFTTPYAPLGARLSLHGYATLRDAMAAIQSVRPGAVAYKSVGRNGWLEAPSKPGELEVVAFFERG